MPKINSNLLILSLSVCFFFVACESGPKITKRGGCSVSEEPGWVDNDTFKVSSQGAASPLSEGETRRKTEAADAALICAQKHILEMFMPGGRIEGVSEYRREILTKEFKGLVKGGVISKKTFDKQQNCQIEFTVSGRNLRKKLPKK